MKKHLFLVGLALCLALGLVTGCGSTPAKSTVGIVIVANVSAKTALGVYNAWLPTHPQKPEQIAVVKAAFLKYQAAELTVLDAVSAIKVTNDDANQTALSAAIADASTALDALLALLRSFGVKV